MSNLSQLNLTKAQKNKLNATRRFSIMEFLSEETWTTASNLSLLINVKHDEYTRRLMDRMLEDGLILKREFTTTEGKRVIYLLSDMGYLELGYDVKPTYSFKISNQNFIHNEKVQRLKIFATLGNNDWLNEREISQNKEYKSRPDGVLIINDIKISIELQRNRYSLIALKTKIAKCLADCFNGNFSKILFVCTDNLNANVMKKALLSVQILKGKDHRDVNFTEEYKAKFEFINYNEFTSYIQNLV